MISRSAPSSEIISPVPSVKLQPRVEKWADEHDILAWFFSGPMRVVCDIIPLMAKKKVLVIDDSAEVRKFMGETLRRLGLEVETAITGKVAVARAKEHEPVLILCDVMLPDPCADAGGLFGGPGTICDESSCRGACCLPTSDCVETEHNACPGEFQGLQTDCAAADCPCPTPFADGDVDGDVDQEDFAVMQECFTGPGPTTVVGQCECFDRDNGGTGDDDVDTDDYAAFEVCATGPGVPVIPCE